MIDAEIMRPVVVLVGWTLVMWAWMYATRLPAMMKLKDLDMAGMVGSTGRTLDDILPPQVQWKAHNYNHLHEQPTLFYAVGQMLALLGAAAKTVRSVYRRYGKGGEIKPSPYPKCRYVRLKLVAL